jgi:lambda repressor-like predicted transcriptional regulator
MKQLARDFCVHRTTIAGCLKKLGIPIRQRGLSVADVPQAVVLYQQGWSLSRLGERYGCDAETVRQVFIREGVARRGAHER